MELGEYPVPQRKKVNCLIRIENKPITYENSFLLKNSTILSEIQVNYVQGIIIAGETIKLGMPRKELKRFISYIGHSDYYVQEENHYD